MLAYETPSASGARYEGQNLTLWTKGSDARLDCATVSPPSTAARSRQLIPPGQRPGNHSPNRQQVGHQLAAARPFTYPNKYPKNKKMKILVI